MTEFTDPETPKAIRDKLNRETSKISWSELLPFFANGVAIYVSHSLDLINVAYELSQDNKKQFEEWMSSGLIANVTDEQAKVWYETNTTVWCVVVKPWVLIQAISD